VTWGTWTNLLGRLESRISRALGDDNALEIEVDSESVGLYWAGIERVPAVVTFVARLIAQHHRLGEPPRLALWEEEGERLRLVEAGDATAFAGELIDWMRIPCLDILRLEVPAAGISMLIRFEGTASRGLLVLSLEGPDAAAIGRLADQLGEELGVDFRFGGQLKPNLTAP
jgi:hypothetical protein